MMSGTSTSSDEASTINHDVQTAESASLINCIKPSSTCISRRAASAASQRCASSGNGGEHYVPGSRRQRACKERVTSVGDYIRTVMQQLQSGTQSFPPDHIAGGASLAADSSAINPLASRPVIVASPRMRFRSARPARTTTSSASSSSEQQVWLMIVERMREEIIKARDVHRADLYRSKSSKRRRLPSANGLVNLIKDQKNAEAAKQRYCTVCNPKQSPATAITVCGHYLCWACLCKWHHKDASSSLTASKKECPCCKKILTKSQVTFVGEKLEDDMGGDPSFLSSSSLSLATDHRDRLLQAAAIPILSSRLHDLSAYKPALSGENIDSSQAPTSASMARSAPSDSSLCTPSAINLAGAYNSQLHHFNEMGAQLYLHAHQQYQTPVADATDMSMLNNLMSEDVNVGGGNSLLWDGGLGLRLSNAAMSVEPDVFVYKSGCTDTPAALVINNSELSPTYSGQSAAVPHGESCSWPPVISNEENQAFFSLYTSSQVFTERAALTSRNDVTLRYADHIISEGNCLYEDISRSTTRYDNEEGSNATMEQFIQKVLEIEASDEAFTVAERNELRQLQEALKQQLDSHKPLNTQSWAWLSTLLATTSQQYSGPSQNMSYISKELPTHNVSATPCGYIEPQALQTPQSFRSINTDVYHAEIFNNPNALAGCPASHYAGQQALNFSSKSTSFSSTSVLSPSSTNNHYNDIATPGCAAACPHQDDAISSWRSLYDADAWDWPISDGHSSWG